MNLSEHFEQRLGTITGGSGRKVDGVQIVHYVNGIFLDVEAWSTLGMSRHVLAARGTESRYLLEVFLAVRAIPDRSVKDVGRCVEWLAEMMVGRHEARIRGDVQELPGPIHDLSALDHVYFANPVYYDEAFYDVEANGQRAGIVWLIPIGRREAQFVREHGWQIFEERLELVDPDLFDMTRPEIV
ncbi:suppressor of fused domain protein [Promicromonospora alba]|uniref:Suppressor of fused domain protein n=1 Tax=Promicromonospora alba TaxID=1616110 RepID=A0ABV9HAL0_9MICO